MAALNLKSARSAFSRAAQGGHRALDLGIDIVVSMRDVGAQCRGKDREDCMGQFRAAWDHFCTDPARLSQFLETKRKRL